MKIVAAIWACIAQLGVVFGEPEPQSAYGLTQPYFESSESVSHLGDVIAPTAPVGLNPQPYHRQERDGGGDYYDDSDYYDDYDDYYDDYEERRGLPWFWSKSPREVYVMAIKNLIINPYATHGSKAPLWSIRQKLTQYGFDTYFAKYGATTDSIMNMLAKEAENGEVSFGAFTGPFFELDEMSEIPWRQLPNAAKEDDSYVQLTIRQSWTQIWYPEAVRAGLRNSAFVGEDGKVYLEDSLACELAKVVVGNCQYSQYQNTNGEMCADSFCTTGSWAAWKEKEVQTSWTPEDRKQHPRPSFSDFWDESDIERFFIRGGMGVVTDDGIYNFAWGSTSSLVTSSAGGQVGTAFDNDPKLKCCAKKNPYYQGQCYCLAERTCSIYKRQSRNGKEYKRKLREVGRNLKRGGSCKGV